MKDKSEQQDKDTKEGSNLQVAGPSGEITAGIVPKESCRAQVLPWKYIFLMLC
jgi:dynamin 1/3